MTSALLQQESHSLTSCTMCTKSVGGCGERGRKEKLVTAGVGVWMYCKYALIKDKFGFFLTLDSIFRVFSMDLEHTDNNFTYQSSIELPATFL